MRPLLCATVTGTTTADLRRARDEAARTSDLVEVRLDSVGDPDPAGAVDGRSCPIIVTCRPSWEGGSFGGSEDERRRLLERALEAGAEYVDVEARAAFARSLVERHKSRVVLSRHWFDGLPADIEGETRPLLASEAAVVKVAVRARSLADTVALVRLAKCRPPNRRIVLIGMGLEGLATRVLPDRFESVWTYAGDGVAPGQLPLARMLNEFRFRSLTPDTAVYGVVGAPIGHSVSPAMHNAAFRAEGIDAIYLPLAAADADDFLGFAEAFRLQGASITVPYKVVLAARAHESDEVSRRVGAVNTIRFEGRRMVATNTDVEGFLAPIARVMPLAAARAAVLGAGGAARAAAVALEGAGARVSVFARRVEKAAEVARLVGGQSGAMPPPPGSWDLLVNATPAGMSPREDDTPIPAPALAGGRFVYDLIYNPAETRLMREARAAGCAAIGGLEMLVAQGAAQFRWWTGRRPSVDLMRAAATERLAVLAREAA